MRLFIAIQLNPDIRDALTDLQSRMQRLGVRGNYTRPENLHLTLAFIGEYGDPDHVLEVLDQIRFEPFRLRLKGIGSFRSLWWAGTEECPELNALVRRIRRGLSEAGIPFDRKKFSPHITLVRKPVSRDGSIPREVLEHAPAADMMADHISLMRSDRGRKGMIYTELT
ncbi:MAG: RNA 2',3'-cyclic phosphodiesterase [Firmicutes bacterium]|nr:RNA 2',3'-cyclic phosphodiesterase [Bacillota bacterium]